MCDWITYVSFIRQSQINNDGYTGLVNNTTAYICNYNCENFLSNTAYILSYFSMDWKL